MVRVEIIEKGGKVVVWTDSPHVAGEALKEYLKGLGENVCSVQLTAVVEKKGWAI